MTYPIEITEKDLINRGIELKGLTKPQTRKYLSVVHRTFYEFIVYVSMRSLREKVIEANKEILEEPIKAILVEIADAISDEGDFVALWNGRERLDSGEYKTVDIQERLLSIIPPVTLQAILSLQPNIVWSGGEI